MTADVRFEPHTDAAASDHFLTRLRALRESLPSGAREVRYRLEEMERRLLLPEVCTDSIVET
jgi:hypothetical protein